MTQDRVRTRRREHHTDAWTFGDLQGVKERLRRPHAREREREQGSVTPVLRVRFARGPSTAADFVVITRDELGVIHLLDRMAPNAFAWRSAFHRARAEEVAEILGVRIRDTHSL